MDPNVAWNNLINRIVEIANSKVNKDKEIFENAVNLEFWLASGGFKPDFYDSTLVRRARNGSLNMEIGQHGELSDWQIAKNLQLIFEDLKNKGKVALMAKSEQLEKLAQTMVGDGKSPNHFFINRDGTILAVLLDHDLAIFLAKMLSGPIVVEDRLTGILWENEASLRQQRELQRKE